MRQVKYICNVCTILFSFYIFQESEYPKGKVHGNWDGVPISDAITTPKSRIAQNKEGKIFVSNSERSPNRAFGNCKNAGREIVESFCL